MIHISVNGIDITGRFLKKDNRTKIDGHGWPTALKRAALISAFEAMPDEMVNEIWERGQISEPILELLPNFIEEKE